MNLAAVKNDDAQDDDNDVGTEPDASKDSKDAVVKATRPQGRSIWLHFFVLLYTISSMLNFSQL